jgi:hypothetical protein
MVAICRDWERMKRLFGDRYAVECKHFTDRQRNDWRRTGWKEEKNILRDDRVGTLTDIGRARDRLE